MEIIDRTTAKNSGLKRYFTGKPCSKGHLAYRYVVSGGCSECINGAPKATPVAAAQEPVARSAADSAELARQMRDFRDVGKTRFWLHDETYNVFRDRAMMLLRMHFPMINPVILEFPRNGARPSGATQMYLVPHVSSDMDALVIYADALRAPYRRTPEQLRHLNTLIHKGVPSEHIGPRPGWDYSWDGKDQAT